jgi:hypothetical protein
VHDVDLVAMNQLERSSSRSPAEQRVGRASIDDGRSTPPCEWKRAVRHELEAHRRIDCVCAHLAPCERRARDQRDRFAALGERADEVVDVPLETAVPM